MYPSISGGLKIKIRFRGTVATVDYLISSEVGFYLSISCYFTFYNKARYIKARIASKQNVTEA